MSTWPPGTPLQSPRDFWDQRLGDRPDASSVGCAGFGRRYNDWLYRVRRSGFRRLVRRLSVSPANCRVLDVGSGTGFYIEQWRAMGATRIEALDFSQSAVRHLRGRFPSMAVHHADLSAPSLPLESGQYDLISAFDVLFHLVEDAAYARAIANVSNLLKPGGFLLLSENFTHRERPRASWYHYSRPLKTIEHQLQANGLRLIERRPMFVLMNAPDDSGSRLLGNWWRGVSRIAMAGERAGWLAGASLYPIEQLLTGLLREGPSTEWAICRRESGN
ncbi:MAG: class I SAM-dependent methyltransferase [Lysobacterales bacterium]